MPLLIIVHIIKATETKTQSNVNNVASSPGTVSIQEVDEGLCLWLN